VRFKIILEGSMKKLLFLFLCLAAVAGFVVADDYRPPGASALEITLSGYGFHEAAVTPATVLVMVQLIETEPASFHIVIQCQERFLTYNDFKTLGMKSLAEKTRKKVDRLFMYRELELRIPRPISVALDGVDYPLRL
jgi:hypothetical protein